MGPIINKHVQQIIAEIDGTEEEKADIKEELLTHLHMLRDDLITEGKTEEEADTLAIQHFGGSATVGKEMQQAMYPYRNKALLCLSVLSFIVLFTLYPTALFLDRDAYIGWLFSGVTTSLLLLPISVGFWPILKRKTWLTILLIMHLLFLSYGYLIGGSIYHGISILFQCTLLICMILSIILLYRIIIFEYPAHTVTIKWIYFLNLTVGIGYIGTMFFALWILLAFFEAVHPFAYVASLIPVFFWILLYYLQIRLLKNGKQTLAFILTIVSCSVLPLLLWVFLR